jgi:hypothetical protein
MRYLILIVIINFNFLCSAQNKIEFSYDAAGNQIRREICLGCKMVSGKEVKDENTVNESDMMLVDQDQLDISSSDKISYYPNPVREELYLSWEANSNKSVTAIQLFSLNGQLLQTFIKLNGVKQTIPFFNYPTGMYLVVFQYSNGEQKSIKIMKKNE